MTKVGVMGLGMMGATHLDVYRKHPLAQVIAVADCDPARRSGQTTARGNIEGQAQQGFDFDTVKQYADGRELINDEEVEVVDICLPTPLHAEYAILAIEAGKHVLIEKPLERNLADARTILQAAEKTNRITMCAMCMRFWPGWTWLKKHTDERTFGAIQSATFRRVAEHPGGDFYSNGDACGGAILDLHIHDTDFIHHLLGMPKAVTSQGYSNITNQIDHVVTRYHYDDIPLVLAEGGWSMAKGFGFRMQYTVNFETATAEFDLAAKTPLILYRNGSAEKVDLPEGMGYDWEIDYFLQCVQNRRQPERVTIAEAAESIRLIEAEIESIHGHHRVTL